MGIPNLCGSLLHPAGIPVDPARPVWIPDDPYRRKTAPILVKTARIYIFGCGVLQQNNNLNGDCQGVTPLDKSIFSGPAPENMLLSNYSRSEYFPKFALYQDHALYNLVTPMFA